VRQALGQGAVVGEQDQARAVSVEATDRIQPPVGRDQLDHRLATVGVLGVVSTAQDTHGRQTVVELVASDRRLYPVGRLDADSTGLILLTNDGSLAERLSHPRYEVPRTYRATVAPPDFSAEALRALRDGVRLEDGLTAPAEVHAKGGGRFELVLREGRNRQVRRMCEAVGHRVTALERVAFGGITLGNLRPGASRRLGADEIERLTESPG